MNIERTLMLEIIIAGLIIIWGGAIALSWFVIFLGVIGFKELFLKNGNSCNNVFKCNARIACFIALLMVLSPFFFEAILFDAYVFKGDGTHVETIDGPRFMLQSTYDKRTSHDGLVAVQELEAYQVGSGQIPIPINDHITVKLQYRITSYDNEINLVSAAIKAGVDVSSHCQQNGSIFTRYFLIRATNEIATIQKKAAELIPENYGYTNQIIIRTDLESLVLHELTPVLSEYNAYVVSIETSWFD